MSIMLFTYLEKQTVLSHKQSGGVTGTGTGFIYLCHLHITRCHNM